MFYVVYGCSTPDCYVEGRDDMPVLRVEECLDEAAVLALIKEFNDSLHPSFRNRTFRVIEGRERVLVPVEKVVAWEFK